MSPSIILQWKPDSNTGFDSILINVVIFPPLYKGIYFDKNTSKLIFTFLVNIYPAWGGTRHSHHSLKSSSEKYKNAWIGWIKEIYANLPKTDNFLRFPAELRGDMRRRFCLLALQRNPGLMSGWGRLSGVVARLAACSARLIDFPPSSSESWNMSGDTDLSPGGQVTLATLNFKCQALENKLWKQEANV